MTTYRLIGGYEGSFEKLVSTYQSVRNPVDHHMSVGLGRRKKVVFQDSVTCTGLMRGFMVIFFLKYYWDGQIKETKMNRACSTREINIFFLSEMPERKIPLGRPRCKLEDNIKMDLI
jgi:hypothetical protein